MTKLQQTEQHSHHFTTSLKDNKGQKIAAETMKEVRCDKIQDFIQEQNSWDTSMYLRSDRTQRAKMKQQIKCLVSGIA